MIGVPYGAISGSDTYIVILETLVKDSVQLKIDFSDIRLARDIATPTSPGHGAFSKRRGSTPVGSPSADPPEHRWATRVDDTRVVNCTDANIPKMDAIPPFPSGPSA